MSIKEELINLASSRKDLDNQVSLINSVLMGLYEQKESLDQKIREFGKRNSALAKKLCDAEKIKLQDLLEQIAQKEKELERVLNAIEKNVKAIEKREESPTLYFQEQIPRMVSEFLKSVKAHEEEFGSNLKKVFAIKDVTKARRINEEEFIVPTGDIGIYDIANNVMITQTEDFYFTESLYTIGIKFSCVLEVINSPWYQEYRKKFVSYFSKELQKAYPFSDTFKLTIKSPKITLELV